MCPLVIFLMANYGEGEPTDNAIDFNKWMTNTNKTVRDNYLSNVSFTVFGLGNRHYEFFNRMGTLISFHNKYFIKHLTLSHYCFSTHNHHHHQTCSLYYSYTLLAIYVMPTYVPPRTPPPLTPSPPPLSVLFLSFPSRQAYQRCIRRIWCQTCI